MHLSQEQALTGRISRSLNPLMLIPRRDVVRGRVEIGVGRSLQLSSLQSLPVKEISISIYFLLGRSTNILAGYISSFTPNVRMYRPQATGWYQWSDAAEWVDPTPMLQIYQMEYDVT